MLKFIPLFNQIFEYDFIYFKNIIFTLMQYGQFLIVRVGFGCSNGLIWPDSINKK